MNNRHLKHTLNTSVPNPPAVFSQAMQDTLSGIVQAEAKKENQSMNKIITKRRMMVPIIICALLIASVALAAVLLNNNVFYNTIGTTPENAESITHYDLADEVIGNAEVKVTEAAYDGMSLFISYSIRDLTATEPMGIYDEDCDMRLLTEEDCEQIDALDAGWWVDNIWVDGKAVNMPSMSGGIDVGTDTPGEVLYSIQYRLDQEDVYLNGDVQISLPIGERQSLDSLTTDPETGDTALPDKGIITFTLDCSTRDLITELTPNIETVGERWSAKVSDVVFTPILTYITVDWSVDPDVMQAYIDANGDGFYGEDGTLYWAYDGVDAVGSEIQSLQLVDENGTPVFTSWDGAYGNQGVGPEQAWFTFPYSESLPDTLYLAPDFSGEIDMSYAIRVR